MQPNQKQRWTNFFLGSPLFGCAILFSVRLGTQKMDAQDRGARPIETQIETLLFLLYNLNRAFVLNVLSLKVLQQDFCSLNVVLMSKIRCDSKNNFHISDLLV